MTTTSARHEEPDSAGTISCSPAEARDVLARFASGVTVVTARSADGVPVGITATSFTSLSLHPLLVLVCIAKSAYSHAIFVGTPRFAVSVLSSAHEELAMRYATRGAAKFFDDDYTLLAPSGLPVIAGSIAHFECEVHSLVEGGDHTVLIGRVMGLGAAEGTPLVHFDRSLGTFGLS